MAKNVWAIFDPARWPHRELLARVVGVLFVGAFFVRRFFQLPNEIAISEYYRYHGYPPETCHRIWVLWMVIWVIESGIFVGYLLAFLTRDRAKSVARGFAEVAFPMLLGMLPLTIVMTDYAFSNWMPPRHPHHLKVLVGLLGVVMLGATINMVGLFALRRAFTIMTEARTLVRSGLYRFIRHPLYAGQFVLYFGYTMLHLHVATGALYVVFVAAQCVRAWNEERKLAAAFPEYADYRAKTGMFFPRLRRKSP